MEELQLHFDQQRKEWHIIVPRARISKRTILNLLDDLQALLIRILNEKMARSRGDEERGGDERCERKIEKENSLIRGLNRILGKELFLSFLDWEVKRAKRYQNPFSILRLDLKKASGQGNGKKLQTCAQKLTYLLEKSFRASDLIGILGKDRFAILLPYADKRAGNCARLRLEANWQDFGLAQEGYQAKMNQICFSPGGRGSLHLFKKFLGKEE